ncbi:hypothetical protein JZ751_000905 [Albula glossodonta]|uniref:Chromodomain Y-like protein n=1 Tax=Albula glossodonta TaxID=121402 RepID=A0A8T2PXP4_9TELE|nr:hypothetical protein JZ751_000905 [Albula glossodonta]
MAVVKIFSKEDGVPPHLVYQWAYCTSTFMAALAANGTASLQNAVTGVTSVSGSAAAKRRFEERSAFDKRLRFSVRQTESAYRYRDIVVKKQDGFTHILLSTKSSENNSLNPDVSHAAVMKEVQSAMTTAAADDSKLVLLSAVGSVFCFGLDFIYFIRRLTDDRKKESAKMAESISVFVGVDPVLSLAGTLRIIPQTFVNTFIQFKKPIIVAVNGPAVGLGASILPLCDVIWANEKAWFQTPYATFGQTPDACSSLTFPRIMGVASVSKRPIGQLRRPACALEGCRQCLQKGSSGTQRGGEFETVLPAQGYGGCVSLHMLVSAPPHTALSSLLPQITCCTARVTVQGMALTSLAQFSSLGQDPSDTSSIGCYSVSLFANEMLLSGRKLTAQEACAKGLVSQVFWPGTFTQEVMVLRESKALVRNTNRTALEQANERECEALKRVWGSPQGMDSILKYLHKKIDEPPVEFQPLSSEVEGDSSNTIIDFVQCSVTETASQTKKQRTCGLFPDFPSRTEKGCPQTFRRSLGFQVIESRDAEVEQESQGAMLPQRPALPQETGLSTKLRTFTGNLQWVGVNLSLSEKPPRAQNGK